MPTIKTYRKVGAFYIAWEEDFSTSIRFTESFGKRREGQILFRLWDLFLGQEIKVGLAARPRIDDGGKVAGKIVPVTSVGHGKRKGYLQRDLGSPDEFTVSPWLTINRDFATGSDCIQE